MRKAPGSAKTFSISVSFLSLPRLHSVDSISYAKQTGVDMTPPRQTELTRPARALVPSSRQSRVPAYPSTFLSPGFHTSREGDS